MSTIVVKIAPLSAEGLTPRVTNSPPRTGERGVAVTGEIQMHGGRAGVRLRLPEAESFDRLLERLGQRLAVGPPLTGRAVTIDAGGRQLQAEELRLLESVLLEQHGALLLQVVDGRETTAGLMERASGSTRIVATEARPRRAARIDGADTDTVLLKRTLRSGQRVRYDGSVVVLGDVNPGAEVVATGDIVIMGTLRGVAHAGAAGNLEAIVAAFRLQPTQLRIASVIGRAPDVTGGGGLDARRGVRGVWLRTEVPEVARVRDGAVSIERYQPSAADLA